MVCGPSSPRSRSSWKYLRLKPPLATLISSRPVVLSRFHVLQALTTPPPFVLFISGRFLDFLFPSCPFLCFFFFVALTLVLPALLRRLVRKVVIGPSATTAVESSRESEVRIARKDWGLCGDRVIAATAVAAVVRDPRECLPYITGGCRKVQGTRSSSFHPPGSEPAIPSL